MRSLRSELASLVLVMAVPATTALVFPYEALTFRAHEPTVSAEPSFSIVRLSPEAQQRALKTARTSWRTADDVRRMRVPLANETLPEDGSRPVLAESVRSSLSTMPSILCDRVPYAPSLAAPALRRLPSAAPQVIPLAFSREELLRLK